MKNFSHRQKVLCVCVCVCARARARASVRARVCEHTSVVSTNSEVPFSCFCICCTLIQTLKFFISISVRETLLPLPRQQ
jgi:hypothetical protein